MISFCTLSGGKPVDWLTQELRVLKFWKVTISLSFFQKLVNHRFQRSNGTFRETIFRLTESMVFVKSNILTKISKTYKNSFSLSANKFVGKIRFLPLSVHIVIKAALLVSALLFLIGCTRTKREKMSTDTIRNLALELQEENLSTCAKSIHHISLT